MKLRLKLAPFCISLLFLFSNRTSFAQSIPTKMMLGDVKVTIDNDVIPMMQTEIDNLNSNKKYLDSLFLKINLFFPSIERILAENGVPDDFKYLAVQESRLMPEVISTSDAVGFWQFKRETALELGLRIDQIVDERKNLFSSTKAASAYLLRSNQALNNWVLSLLSYRVGLGAVKRGYPQLINGNKTINVTKNTDWYVIRFLAYRYFLTSQARNYPRANAPQLFAYNSSGGKDLSEIAKQFKTDYEKLKYINSWCKTTTIPNDKNYVVYFPYLSSTNLPNYDYSDITNNDAAKSITETSGDLSTSDNDLGFPVLKYKEEIDGASFYEINGKLGILAKIGDTPETISNRGSIGTKKFLHFNDLKERDPIIPGKVYYLKKKNKKAPIAYYTAKGNETLWTVSQMFGVRLESLKDKNHENLVQRLQKGRLVWLNETRPKNVGIEIVKLNDEPAKVTEINLSEPSVSDNSTTTFPVKNTDVIINKTKITPPKSTEQYTKPYENTAIISKKPAAIESPSRMQIIENEVTKIVSPAAIDPYSGRGGIKQTHIVMEGQTYASIAKLYNMNVQDLLSLNNIKDGMALRINQKLIVVNGRNTISKVQEIAPKNIMTNEDKPSNPSPVVVPDEPIVVKPEPKIIKKEVKKTVQPFENNPTLSYYTVKPKETLYSISKANGLTVVELKQLNNIDSDELEEGERLIIAKKNGISASSPKAVPAEKQSTIAPKAVSKSQYYTLLKGETVYRVSVKTGVSVEKIVELNNIKNFNVSEGQKLLIRK